MSAAHSALFCALLLAQALNLSLGSSLYQARHRRAPRASGTHGPTRGHDRQHCDPLGTGAQGFLLHRARVSNSEQKSFDESTCCSLTVSSGMGHMPCSSGWKCCPTTRSTRKIGDMCPGSTRSHPRAGTAMVVVLRVGDSGSQHGHCTSRCHQDTHTCLISDQGCPLMNVI